MNRTIKSFAMAAAAASLTGIMASSASYGQKSTPASADPIKFSLTIEKGKPGGSYPAGTLVTVVADAAPAGAQFTGWTGDVAILANPFIPETSATIPYMAVTITATYSAPVATYTAPVAKDAAQRLNRSLALRLKEELLEHFRLRANVPEGQKRLGR